MRKLSVLVIATALSVPAWSQTSETPRATPLLSILSTQTVTPTPAAAPDDVDTMDDVIHAMYQAISGPAGQKRNWDRFRSLFLPDARLILAIGRQGQKPSARILTVEDYIRRADRIFEKESFWENERGRNTEKSGNIAHAFSYYESRQVKNGKPFQTGVNSIQLFNDGTRWWIATVMWNTGRE